jgi:hypothetical protein
MDFNAELLAPGPADDRTIDKHSGVWAGEKDAQSNYRPGLNRMRPIDTPSIEGEIPGNPASLERIAGIID